MSIALLLLGLMPLAFLPDLLFGNDDEAEETGNGDLGLANQDVGDLLTDPGVGVPLAPSITDDTQDSDAQDPPVALFLQALPDTADEPDFIPADGDPLQPVDHMDPTNSTIRLDFEDVVATGYAEIGNFDTQSDVLEIIIEQASIQNGLDVLVTPSDNGEDAMVHIEGHLFAVLSGAPDASVANLQVVIGDLGG